MSVITDTHVFFYQGIFSQFYKSDMIIDKVSYFCCEQYMMASKAKLFEDKEIFYKIMKADTPMKCKKLGRQVKNFDQKIWNENKYKIVKKGNLAKFKQNKELKKQLLSYGDRTFVEASRFDKIWGIGLGINNPLIMDVKNWKGQNLLGKAITEVRDVLK